MLLRAEELLNEVVCVVVIVCYLSGSTQIRCKITKNVLYTQHFCVKSVLYAERFWLKSVLYIEQVAFFSACSVKK